ENDAGGYPRVECIDVIRDVSQRVAGGDGQILRDRAVEHLVLTAIDGLQSRVAHQMQVGGSCRAAFENLDGAIASGSVGDCTAVAGVVDLCLKAGPQRIELVDYVADSLRITVDRNRSTCAIDADDRKRPGSYSRAAVERGQCRVGADGLQVEITAILAGDGSVDRKPQFVGRVCRVAVGYDQVAD